MSTNQSRDVFRHVTDPAFRALLDRETAFDPSSGRLEIRTSHGFCSNCTITLSALTSLYPRREHVWVDWPCQDHWRDKGQNQANLFNDYFVPGGDVAAAELRTVPPVHLRCHEAYDNLDLKKLAPYIRHFFRPSPAVEELVAQFTLKYQIDCSKTVGLCYRGTDKWTEIDAVGPLYYFGEAQRVLDREPDMRLLVQTDDGRVRDRAKFTFGDRAFYLEELPVTYSGIVPHLLSQEERHLSNYHFGLNLLAAVVLLSRVKYVITHTGNVGLWIYLFRGDSRGACQLLPSRPEIISRLPGLRNTVERNWVLSRRRAFNLLRRLPIR